MADNSSFRQAKRVNSIRIKNNNSKSAGEKIIVDHYVSTISIINVVHISILKNTCSNSGIGSEKEPSVLCTKDLIFKLAALLPLNAFLGDRDLMKRS